MKLTKTLLTTALFAFSTALVSPVSYADNAEMQFQQGLTAYKQGDYHTAFKLFQPLAEQGYVFVQTLLGALYVEGKGVKQDYSQAVKWYQKAAEQGEAEAQFNLGVMYRKGKGLKQDFFQAVKWFQKAGEQEYAAAQNNLAIAYRLGLGVKEDREQAKYWASKACSNGNPSGCEVYRMLSEGK